MPSYAITLRAKPFFGQINERKQFRIFRDERIPYLYIGTILTQSLFCFDALLDFVSDFFMLRVEGDSLTKIIIVVKCQRITSNCVNWATFDDMRFNLFFILFLSVCVSTCLY